MTLTLKILLVVSYEKRKEKKKKKGFSLIVLYVVHTPTNALFINLVKSFKFALKYAIISLHRSDIIVYFNVNLKLLTKLINSAFVGV